MSTTGYIVRDAAGNLQQGIFAEGNPSTIYVSHTKDISLNLAAGDVHGFERHGQDLHVVLQGGEVLILNGYFNEGTTGDKNLFLSEEGEMLEVVLEDRADGYLAAGYEPLDMSGKWSSYDEMVFLDVDRIEPTVAPLAAAGFGGFGAAGAAAAGGAALLSGGGGDGGGGGGGGGGSVITPTVDDADLDRIIGGTGDDTVIVTGTGSAGSTVEVTIGTETQTVTIGSGGTWTATFDPGDLPADGIYASSVYVRDLEGNTWTLAGPEVDIDTTPPDLDVTAGVQSAGEVINAVEHASGTVISGTSEAGATVEVEINGTAHTTTADSSGSWSVTFSSGEILTGEYDNQRVTITTTDSRGNSDTFSELLEVDTILPHTVIATVEGDNVIDAAESSDGVVLHGTTEPGATVTVEFQGVPRAATVAADGSWSVSYTSAEIGVGNYESTVSVTAVDAAGNVYNTSQAVFLDTSPDIVGRFQSGSHTNLVSVDGVDPSLSIHALATDGSTTSPSATKTYPGGDTQFAFDTPLSDGNQLVVSRENGAGESTSTLYILNPNASSTEVFEHAGLGQFDIDALDLGAVDSTNLSLTEAQIKALSGNSDTLVVHGESGDALDVSQAVDTGETQTINGEAYTVYTVGTDATLLVDEDVTVNII